MHEQTQPMPRWQYAHTATHGSRDRAACRTVVRRIVASSMVAVGDDETGRHLKVTTSSSRSSPDDR